MNKQLETALFKAASDARALLEHMENFPQNRTQRNLLKTELDKSLKQVEALKRK